nr:unnamed protein product [Digitaria exilis]
MSSSRIRSGGAGRPYDHLEAAGAGAWPAEAASRARTVGSLGYRESGSDSVRNLSVSATNPSLIRSGRVPHSRPRGRSGGGGGGGEVPVHERRRRGSGGGGARGGGLSRTCRRDSYCAVCTKAFCSHCCGFHHSWTGFHVVIPIALDAATGQPSLPTHYPGSRDPIPAFIADRMAAADYATPLAVDAYCVACMAPFCERAACYHHRRGCGGGDAVLRLEVRGGRHYVRCRGDEDWFSYLERILGDPVADDDADARAEEEAAGHVRAVRRAGAVPDLTPLLAVLRRSPQPRGRPASGA